MNYDSNLPMGASTDPRAPYNEKGPEDRSFKVLISQTLSKEVEVISSDYTDEIDEDGNYYINTSEIDWEDEYHENDHYDIPQLLGILEDYIQDELDRGGVNHSVPHLKHLLKECQDWTEDEKEVIES